MTEPAGLHVTLRQSEPIPLEAEIACAPGELLALVGPSGSGKSTILRCIAGLHFPAEGVVRCNGETWFDPAAAVHLPPQARRIGFVFQSYALFPHLSALENVVASLGHVPAGKREARARELLARVHLHGLENRRPQALSGGQQQRVAVARALARDPAVLLLDEPFSAVDQVTRRKLQRELARLRADLKIPMLLVTHDLDEARMLADRLAILHRGSTLQSGDPDTVLARPRNALVARLVGLSNLFEGTVEAPAAEGGRMRLAWMDRLLELDHAGGYAPGMRVCWVVPPENILLHHRVRPAQGDRENPVSGVLGECIALGATTSLTLWVDGDRRHPLSFSVPTHVARRNGLAQGESVSVSLLASGIHLMPWEPLSDPRQD